MEGLQRQMLELNYKVDCLYKIVERLSNQIESLLAYQLEIAKSQKPPTTPKPRKSKAQEPTGVVSAAELAAQIAAGHKDIIDDRDLENKENPELDGILSPGLQIRRLTAQLTASYQRIAILEEQLLAKREHFSEANPKNRH